MVSQINQANHTREKLAQPGIFITLEGVDGVGKSTQARLLIDWLQNRGHTVEFLREPGGTPIGERVRELLLDPAFSVMAPTTELLLYEASRAQIVAEKIAPALQQGYIVICDRFYDSTTAYQGYGRGINRELISELNQIAVNGCVPDLTLIFDASTSTLDRATQAGADRLEQEGDEFQAKVQAGFCAIAADDPERVKLIDAQGTPDEVHKRVMAVVTHVFDL